MEFHLTVTNYVGSVSTLVNGIFVILIVLFPPDNLGIFRSQYYVGAFASFFFAVTQLWSAFFFVPNGTLFIIFPARVSAGAIGFLSFVASTNLQFTMLSSNFAVRFAAVRGGWIKDYLTNHYLFYGIQFTSTMGAYIPLIVLLSPTPELRAVAHATYGETYDFDFLNDYYFVCSYEYITWDNIYVHQSIHLMAVAFQGINLLIMLVFGVITYVFLSINTQSKKLRDVNNRLLRIRILQAIFSFLFLFMPGLLMNSTMLLRMDVSFIAPYISSMFTFGTFFNPFLDYTLTPGYRKRCDEHIRRTRIFKTLFKMDDKSSTDKTVSTVTVQFARNTAPPRIIQFHLTVTNYFGSISTLVNGIFVILIVLIPPDNLGIFRSQYYVGAFASFFFAATQLWSAFFFVPNGTLFIVFPARVSAGAIGFLSFIASTNLQFTMLSSNFAVRFAAVRGGWIKDYLTNHYIFYGIQFTSTMSAYIPSIVLLSPTPELRFKEYLKMAVVQNQFKAIAHATYGDTYNFDFLNDYYLISSYDYLIWSNIYVHQSIFLLAVGFQAINLLIMLFFGVVTYVYLSINTQSKKLREVNNRLLRIRILQAVFSFAFLFMPGLFINSSMLLRIDASCIAPHLSSIFVLGTFFNPFLDYTLTPGYRKRCGEQIRRARILRTLFNMDFKSPADKTFSTVTVQQFTRNTAPQRVVLVK